MLSNPMLSGAAASGAAAPVSVKCQPIASAGCESVDMTPESRSDSLEFVARALARFTSTGATDQALSTGDRQVIAIATAYLRGEHDRIDALAREHLLEHPDSVVVSLIADLARRNQHPS
jgi:hypothetical protein